MSELDELFVANHKLVIKACRQCLPIAWELDDWVQECYLHVWSGLRKFDPTKGTLATWIYAVVRNHANSANQARAFKGRTTRVVSLAAPVGEERDSTLSEIIPDRQPSHEEMVMRRLDLERALAFVSPDERVLFELKAAGEKRCDLIAQGATRGALDMRWKRARKQVAQTLEAYSA
jgi:RNA polymerase sigma factor (sigma-70 family)